MTKRPRTSVRPGAGNVDKKTLSPPHDWRNHDDRIRLIEQLILPDGSRNFHVVGRGANPVLKDEPYPSGLSSSASQPTPAIESAIERIGLVTDGIDALSYAIDRFADRIHGPRAPANATPPGMGTSPESRPTLFEAINRIEQSFQNLLDATSRVDIKRN